MTKYRVNLTHEYGEISQNFADLDRANRQAKTWRMIFPAATIKIEREKVTYDADDDMWTSYEECLAAVRERKANGGRAWQPK